MDKILEPPWIPYPQNKVVTIMVSTYVLCSICVHSFGAFSKVVRLFMASLHMCSHVLFAKCDLKCGLLTFSSISNRLTLSRGGGLFGHPVWWVRRTWGVGDRPIWHPAHGFLIGPYWHIWYLLLFLSYFEKRFLPFVRPSDPYAMTACELTLYTSYTLLRLSSTMYRTTSVAQSIWISVTFV